MMNNFYDDLKNKIFRIILGEVRGKDPILDIGCGSCKLVLFLAKKLKNVKVVGVDLYSGKLPNITEKVREEKIANQVQCIKADASDLNFLSKESFGAVVSVYSLHEFHTTQRTLREAFRILNQEGKIVIVDFIRETLADRLWGEKYYSPEEIEEIVEKAGFWDIKSRLLSREGPVIFTGAKKEGNE